MASVSDSPPSVAERLGIPLKYVPSASGCDLSLSHLFGITFKDFMKDFLSDKPKAQQLMAISKQQIRVFGPTLMDFRHYGYTGSGFKLQALFNEIKKVKPNIENVPHINNYIVKKINEFVNKKLEKSSYFLNSNDEDYHLDSSQFVSFEHLSNEPNKLKDLARMLNESENELNAYFKTEPFLAEVAELEAFGNPETFQTKNAKTYPLCITRPEDVSFEYMIGSHASPSHSYVLTIDSKHLCIREIPSKKVKAIRAFDESNAPCAVQFASDGKQFFSLDVQNNLLLWRFDPLTCEPLLVNTIRLRDVKSPSSPNFVCCNETLVVYWQEGEATHISFWPLRDFVRFDIESAAFEHVIPYKIDHLAFSASVAITTHLVKPLVNGKYKTRSEIMFWRWPNFERVGKKIPESKKNRDSSVKQGEYVQLISEEVIANVSLSPNGFKLVYVQTDGRVFLLDIKNPYEALSLEELFKGASSSILFLNDDEIAYLSKENLLRIWSLKTKKIVGEFSDKRIPDEAKLMRSSNPSQILVQSELEILPFNRNNFSDPGKIRRPIEDVKVQNNPLRVTVLERQGYLGELDPVSLQYRLIDSIATLWDQLEAYTGQRVLHHFALSKDNNTVVWIIREDGCEPRIRQVSFYKIDTKQIENLTPQSSKDRFRAVALSNRPTAYILTNTHIKKFDIETRKVTLEIHHPGTILETENVLFTCFDRATTLLAFCYGKDLVCLDFNNKWQKMVVANKKIESLSCDPLGNYLIVKFINHKNEMEFLITTSDLSRHWNFTCRDLQFHEEHIVIIHQLSKSIYLSLITGQNINPGDVGAIMDQVANVTRHDQNVVSANWEGTVVNLLVKDGDFLIPSKPIDLMEVQVKSDPIPVS